MHKSVHRKALSDISTSWNVYHSAKNHVVHLIRKAKRDYYCSAIERNLENPKNIWKIIKNVSPAKTSNLPSQLIVDGQNISDVIKFFQTSKPCL